MFDALIFLFLLLFLLRYSLIHFSLFVVGLACNHLADENFLMLAHLLNEYFQTFEIKMSRVGHIIGHD